MTKSWPACSKGWPEVLGSNEYPGRGVGGTGFAIVIGTNPDHYLNALNLLGRLGIGRHITIGDDSVKELALLSRHCQGFYEIETAQLLGFDESIAGLIESLYRGNGASVVMPICWLSLCYISKLKDRFNNVSIFPCDNLEILQRLHNKWDFHLLLKELGIPAPNPTYMAENRQDLFNISDLRYPVVVKPTEGYGGMGFKRCENRDVLLREAAVVNRFPCILQEYVHGYDVCLNTFSVKGRVMGWTIQEHTEYGLKFVNKPEVLSMGEKILGALQFTGVANFDLRYDLNVHGVKFLECNPRLWGTFFYSAFAGVDFLRLGLDYAAQKQTKPMRQREIAMYTLDKLRLSELKTSLNLVPLWRTLVGVGRFASGGILVNAYKILNDKGVLKRLVRAYSARRTGLIKDWESP